MKTYEIRKHIVDAKIEANKAGLTEVAEKLEAIGQELLLISNKSDKTPWDLLNEPVIKTV